MSGRLHTFHDTEKNHYRNCQSFHVRRKTRTIIAGGRSTVREHVLATCVYVCVDFLGSTFPVSFCIEPGQRQAGAVGGSPDVAQRHGDKSESGAPLSWKGLWTTRRFLDRADLHRQGCSVLPWRLPSAQGRRGWPGSV